MSDQEHWDALAALLRETDLGSDVYDYGKVPGADGNEGTIPTVFAVLSIERRYVEPNKASGTGRTGWRVSVRYVGTTHPTLARRADG
jgi:hypothetical protein